MSVERIEVLQSGRALGVLAVVVAHADVYATGSAAGPLHDLGTIGVVFFFVLSGFLMWLIGREAEAGPFICARLIRIFVPYLPIGIGWAAYWSVRGGEWFTWAASLTLLPLGGPALPVAWTLQHELAFYAVFALGLALRRPLGLLAAWGAVLLVAIPFDLDRAERIFLGQANLPILAGVALAVLAPRLAPLLARYRTPAWSRYLGDASYSIYLVHLPAQFLLYEAGASFLTMLIVGVVMGLAYYHAVERPLLHWVRGLNYERCLPVMKRTINGLIALQRG